jgi:type I restriction enzyme M protein
MLFFDNKPASKQAHTREIWFYDLRTNMHFTLKRNPLRLDDLQDFIDCYQSTNIHQRKETFHAETNPEGRWRKFTYDQIVERDKTSLDITWIKDKSLTDLDNLPDPDLLASDIIENLKSGIESFEEIMLSIKGK